jgi:hypothetical protein
MDVVWGKTGSTEAYYTYGYALCAGDFNGDGFSDLAFGADTFLTPGGRVQSRVYIFFGGRAGLDSIPDVTILHDTAEGGITSLAAVDVNGDGFSDLIVGDWTGYPEFCGSVRIYLGVNPFDTVCDYRIIGPTVASAFGVSVASAGDVNGDGWEDLVVGACDGYVRPGFPAGWVQIFYGGPGFDTSADVNILGGHEDMDEYFGFRVRGGADVNQDGRDDIIVGALNYAGVGRIYVYYGGNPLDTSAYMAFTGEGGTQSLGGCVDLLRNRNGYGNAIAGSETYPYHHGTGYVWYGGSPMDNTPDVRIHGLGDGGWGMMGYAAARAGDLTGDGDDEFMFSDVAEDSGRGAVYVFDGRTNSVDATPIAWIKGMSPYDDVGSDLAPIGDVDGDGRSEIAISDHIFRFRVWVCQYTGPSSVVESGARPASGPPEFSVFPAQVTDHVRFTCRLSGPGRALLSVFDLGGRLRAGPLALDGPNRAGERVLDWDLQDQRGRSVHSGVYLAELELDQKGKVMRRLQSKFLVVR